MSRVNTGTGQSPQAIASGLSTEVGTSAGQSAKSVSKRGRKVMSQEEPQQRFSRSPERGGARLVGKPVPLSSKAISAEDRIGRLIVLKPGRADKPMGVNEAIYAFDEMLTIYKRLMLLASNKQGSSDEIDKLQITLTREGRLYSNSRLQEIMKKCGALYGELCPKAISAFKLYASFYSDEASRVEEFEACMGAIEKSEKERKSSGEKGAVRLLHKGDIIELFHDREKIERQLLLFIIKNRFMIDFEYSKNKALNKFLISVTSNENGIEILRSNYFVYFKDQLSLLRDLLLNSAIIIGAGGEPEETFLDCNHKVFAVGYVLGCLIYRLFRSCDPIASQIDLFRLINHYKGALLLWMELYSIRTAQEFFPMLPAEMTASWAHRLMFLCILEQYQMVDALFRESAVLIEEKGLGQRNTRIMSFGLYLVTRAFCIRGGNLNEEKVRIRKFKDFLCRIIKLVTKDVKLKALFWPADTTNIIQVSYDFVSKHLDAIEEDIKAKKSTDSQLHLQGSRIKTQPIQELPSTSVSDPLPSFIWNQLPDNEKARFDKVDDPLLEAGWQAPIQAGHPVETFAKQRGMLVSVYEATNSGKKGRWIAYAHPAQGVHKSQTQFKRVKPKLDIKLPSEWVSADSGKIPGARQERGSARTETTEQGRSEQSINESGIQDVATGDVVQSTQEKKREGKLTRSFDKRRERPKSVTRTTTEPAASQLSMQAATIEIQKIQELPSSSVRIPLPTYIWNSLSRSERKPFVQTDDSTLEERWYEPIESGQRHPVEIFAEKLGCPVLFHKKTGTGSRKKFVAYVDPNKGRQERPSVIPENTLTVILPKRASTDPSREPGSQLERKTARTETTEQDLSGQPIVESAIQDVTKDGVLQSAKEQTIAGKMTPPSDVRHERSKSITQTAIEPADSQIDLQDAGIKTQPIQELPSTTSRAPLPLMIWEQLSVVEQARFDKVNNPTLEANWWAPIQNGHPVERFATDCKCPVLVYKAMGQGIMDAAETYVLPDKGVQTVIPSEKPKEVLYIMLSERASPDTEMGLSSQQESASARKRTKTTGQGRSEQPILKSGIQDVATDDVVPSAEEKTQESKLTRSSDKRGKRSKPVTWTTTEPAASQLPMPSDTIETQKTQELPSSSGRMSLPTCIWNQLSKSERKLFTENKVSKLERGWYEPIESGYLVENLVAGLNRPVRVYEETEQGSQTKFLAYVDLEKVLHKELPPVIPRNVFRLTLPERAFADSEMRLSSQQERETARTETIVQGLSYSGQPMAESGLQDEAAGFELQVEASCIAGQVTLPSDVQLKRSESETQTTVEPADSQLHLQDTGIIETEQKQELPSKIIVPKYLETILLPMLRRNERERFVWDDDPALLESWKKPVQTGSGHPFATLAQNLKRPVCVYKNKGQGRGKNVPLLFVAYVDPDKGVLERGARWERAREKLIIRLPSDWVFDAPVKDPGQQQEMESVKTEGVAANRSRSMQPTVKTGIQYVFSDAKPSDVKERVTGHLLHCLHRANAQGDDRPKMFIGGSFGRKLQGRGDGYNDIDLYAKDIQDAKSLFSHLKKCINHDWKISSRIKTTGQWRLKDGYHGLQIPYLVKFPIYESEGGQKKLFEIEVNLLEKNVFDEYMQYVASVGSKEYTLTDFSGSGGDALCLSFRGEVIQLIKVADQFCNLYLTEKFDLNKEFVVPRTIIYSDSDIKNDRDIRGRAILMRATMTLHVLYKFEIILLEPHNIDDSEENQLFLPIRESIRSLEQKISGSGFFKTLKERIDQWISKNQDAGILSYITKLRDRLASAEAMNPSLADSDFNAVEADREEGEMFDTQSAQRLVDSDFSFDEEGWEYGEVLDAQPFQLTDSVARLSESLDAYATAGLIPRMPAFTEGAIHQWQVECGEIVQPMPIVWNTGGDSVTTDLSMQSLQPLESEWHWPGELEPNFNVGEDSSWVGGQMPYTQSLLMTDGSAEFCETVPYVAIPMLEGEIYRGHRLIPAVAVWRTGYDSGAPDQPMPSLQPIEKLEDHELSPKKPPMRRHSM